MKKLSFVFFILIATLILQGCSGLPVKLGSAPDEITNYDLNAGREVTASSSGFQLLLFVPIGINQRQERAYNHLKNLAGPGYITDIKITESWSYAFVGTIHTTKITATVYPKKNTK